MKGSAGAVTTLFVVLLLLVVVPSRMMALARAGTIAGFLGATTSTLLVCWFLYRLCLRATRQAWYIGISIAAVYVATFSAPFFAWCALLVLYLVHRYTVRHLQAASRADAPPETISPVAEESERASVEPGPAPKWMQVVDLDGICGSYRRILFSQRFVRAATASLAGTAVLTIPVVFVFAVYDFRAPLFGIVAGVLMTAFFALVCALYFAWLRALWRGSIRAARIGVVATATLAALWLFVGAIRFNRGLLVTGGIWFELTAQAMQLSLIAAMGAGSAVIMWRRRDVALMGLLAQNARHGWRAALLQLCGVVLSGDRALTALARRSFYLSALAFSIEGFAFYVYFKAASNVLELSDSVPSSFAARMSPLEGHYFSLVTVICLVLPVTYVSTQLTLAGAERLRTIARRASLRRAEDLLQEDERPPVLFLRDFKDDQVSLERASVPAWIRVLDPGLEQANMEDVLQACLNIGPAVAIGRPEDVQPPIGAARRYVQGEGWKRCRPRHDERCRRRRGGCLRFCRRDVGGRAIARPRTSRQDDLRDAASDAWQSSPRTRAGGEIDRPRRATSRGDEGGGTGARSRIAPHHGHDTSPRHRQDLRHQAPPVPGRIRCHASARAARRARRESHPACGVVEPSAIGRECGHIEHVAQLGIWN